MPQELDKCVAAVKRKGKVRNPFAVCRKMLGSDEDIKRSRGR
jgi:hypothetical protein